jgi:hypothetical protein
MRNVLISLLAVLCLAGAGSCNKLAEKMDLPGKIAGKVLNADGSGRGYVSVILLKDGAEVQRQNAEDTGNFFLDKIDPGTYTFRIEAMGGGGKELPSEPLEVKLAMGKTKQVEIKLLPEQQEQH